jgi:hypothetical protein
MNDETYKANEARRLNAQLADVEGASLADRREARADFADLLTTPDILVVRVRWLFDGNYGFGAMMRAREIIARRGNQIAAISQLIAALECFCPAAFARQAHKDLSQAQQAAIDTAIASEIATAHSSPLDV